ncbi:MAG: hypothetical protein R6V12_11455 [Candidatus Hydrogenedentota bacterium]
MKHVRSVSRVRVCKAQNIGDNLAELGTFLTLLATLIEVIEALSGSSSK